MSKCNTLETQGDAPTYTDVCISDALKLYTVHTYTAIYLCTIVYSYGAEKQADKDFNVSHKVNWLQNHGA